MADYTRLTSAAAIKLLSNYNLGKLDRMDPLDGGQANSSFKFTTENGAFVLSVCDEKNRKEIDCLTRVLAYLETKAFPTTRPVRTRTGGYFITHGSKPVYVKEFIPGKVIRRLTPDMVCQVGTAVADLHDLPVLKEMPRHFPYGIEAFSEFLKGDLEHPYVAWLGQKREFLEQALDPAMEKGFIHGDIFWDNLLFSHDRLVAILDFEEACCYYKLYDLGMCAVGCCSRNGSFDLQRVTSLITGYQQRRPLSKREKPQLKVFMEYAAVAASFWRFCQYNIKYPLPEKADTYKELSSLADQIHDLEKTRFMECFTA